MALAPATKSRTIVGKVEHDRTVVPQRGKCPIRDLASRFCLITTQMDATPNKMGKFATSGGVLARSGRAQFGTGSASALSMKWSALHDAAQAVASIAGVPCPPLSQAVRAFPAQVRDATGPRKALAEQGIEDLSAIMEPGLATLLSALARGGQPQAAAMALWSEFVHVRDGLLHLGLSPEGTARRMT